MVVHVSFLMVAKLKQETNRSSMTDLQQWLNLLLKSMVKWSSGNSQNLHLKLTQQKLLSHNGREPAEEVAPAIQHQNLKTWQMRYFRVNCIK